MKIRIKQHTSFQQWYRNHVGEVFEATLEDSPICDAEYAGTTKLYMISGTPRGERSEVNGFPIRYWVFPEDAEEVDERPQIEITPESRDSLHKEES